MPKTANYSTIATIREKIGRFPSCHNPYRSQGNCRDT